MVLSVEDLKAEELTAVSPNYVGGVIGDDVQELLNNIIDSCSGSNPLLQLTLVEANAAMIAGALIPGQVYAITGIHRTLYTGMFSGNGILSGSFVSGTGYVDSPTDYLSVPLIGGTGAGATGDIAVGGGEVIGIAIVDPGQDYVIGDVLTVSNTFLGGTGSGFQFTVSTVGNGSEGTIIILQAIYPSTFANIGKGIFYTPTEAGEGPIPTWSNRSTWTITV